MVREQSHVPPSGPAGLEPLRHDIVSVQSQVVYGRVGNNVAVPALEAMGLSVAAVPTVLLSNTPHYPTLHGGAIPVDWFAGYLHDLTARGALERLRGIVTGYMGSAGQVEALADWARPLLDADTDLKLVVDPVLGDHGDGLYVAADLVAAHRRHLLPLAHGLTPNDFELSQLAGTAIRDVTDAVAAARTLLGARTRWVAVTSAAPGTWKGGEMRVVLVTREQAWLLSHPRIDVAPRGTGDLFNATVAAHWIRGAALPEAVAGACRRVLAAMQHTRKLHSMELQWPAPDDTEDTAPVSIRELPRG